MIPLDPYIDSLGAFVERQMQARAERVEQLLTAAMDGTAPDRRWRLHVVHQDGPDGWPLEPAVASWLGDFPPGHQL